jgi:calcineurin-like phosphoesterase family protein
MPPAVRGNVSSAACTRSCCPSCLQPPSQPHVSAGYAAECAPRPNASAVRYLPLATSSDLYLLMESSPVATAASDRPHLIPRPRWVISDTHFGHSTILDYCPWRRTWSGSLAEHDAALIAAWRERVGPDDLVLHLGDVALGPKEYLSEIRGSLPGRIMLVRGNHDRSHAALRAAGFDAVYSAIRIEDGGRHWIGRHNPAAFSVREAGDATRLLHGHCHGNGLAHEIHQAVREKARDCSLDALQAIGPVPWGEVA